MTIDPIPYIPINCEFHDVLEALATTRKPAAIVFLDEAGAQRQITAVIADVHARDGAEFVVLATGESLRLDRLVNVDGEALSDYP